MKKKILLLLSILLMPTLVAGCKQQTKEPEKQTETTKENINFQYVNKGTVILGDKKAYKPDEKLPDDVNVVEIYLDPYCPDCVVFETAIKPQLDKLIKEGKTVVKYHFFTFLSPKTIDDYSNRAASYMLAVAEHKPEIAKDFIDKIMTKEFRPQRGVKTPDETFKKLYMSLGGDEATWNNKIEKSKTQIVEQIKTATAEAFNDTNLINKSPIKDRLFVPFIFVNDSPKAIDAEGKDDIAELFKEYFETYRKK